MKKDDSSMKPLGFGGKDQETELPHEAASTSPQIVNQFQVLPHGADKILIHRPPVHEMSRHQALELAAFLIFFCEDKFHDGESILPLGYVLQLLRNMHA